MTPTEPTDLVPTSAVNLERLTAKFPEAAKKNRVIGGGRRADYYDSATIIRRLNEATGNNWSFNVDRYWTENNVTLALVTLIIPGHGARQHIGVQAADGRSGEDAAAKGAISDALKKAATLFGVGLELYGEDYEAEAAEVQKQVEERRNRDARPVDPEVKRAAEAFVTEAKNLKMDVLNGEGKADGGKCLYLAGMVLKLQRPPRELSAEQWARATTHLADYCEQMGTNQQGGN